MLGVELIVKEAAFDANTVGRLNIRAEVETINVEFVVLPRLVLDGIRNPEPECAVMLCAVS